MDIVGSEATKPTQLTVPGTGGEVDCHSNISNHSKCHRHHHNHPHQQSCPHYNQEYNTCGSSGCCGCGGGSCCGDGSGNNGGGGGGGGSCCCYCGGNNGGGCENPCRSRCKEFAGELQPVVSGGADSSSAAAAAAAAVAMVAFNPSRNHAHHHHHHQHQHSSAVVIAPGLYEDCDSDMELSKDDSGEQSPSSKLCGLLRFVQKRLRALVESNFFQRSILIAILLNTLSMAVEFHNQPETLTLVLEYSNVVFCVLFAMEMAFKLCAYGLFGYISNGFNVFDSFIVILSIVELAQGGASGLSVLRTFRLLRILKLVRFMPALRRQLVVMLRTMDNVATFFALLVLFMFIFSILGMSLFGCKFCKKVDGKRKCDRKNFDSLLWAIITVFQVLTQEDWNTVLYNGMSQTSHWASLYFIALMTFGNYVLFNLLVAILVEGFSTEDEDKKKERIKDEDEDDEDADDENNDGDEDDDDIGGEEQEKRRLVENNNFDDTPVPKSRLNSVDLDVKNNKEKEKKMLALPPAPSSYPASRPGPPIPVHKTSLLEVGTSHSLTPSPAHLSPHPQQDAAGGTANPPIITHTAATPMATPQATPQGSPHENALKDTNNHKASLAVKRSALKSTLSVDSEKSASLNFRGGSPRPSPCLRRNSSRGSNHHSRSGSWRARNRRMRGDKTSLVVDSQSESADDGEDDVFTSGQSQSPTYSVGTPRTPSVNTRGDCNGHPPLNNQRTLSPQNSVKGRALTPRNSFRSQYSWSRNNSVGSARSICNSFELSRQNSFTSHRTLNSLGSGTSKEDNRSMKNFVDLPDVKIALDKEEGQEDKDDDEEDPDAMDETDWNCSWLPEPTGCFLTRHEYSFYLLSNDNRFRKWAHHMISRRWFDNAVLFFIALNCITLAMERPDIPPDSKERRFLTLSNYIFTIVFTSEMAVKVVAKGLFVGKHAYLKSGWNVMDGFLVIISLIDIFITLTAAQSPKIFGILRVFRLLRTLRPLRVISRAPGLKLVVQTLLSSLRPIGNIVLICITFFIIFGILGVQLFKGTFYYCKGENVTHVRNRTQCEADSSNEWLNQKYNFDNLGMALMALFVLASKDGWVQIMYTGLDAVGVDQQPIENYNEWRLIYFISFLLLVAFFVLNMFVGVVVENFHKCRESQEIEERAKRAAKRKEKLDKKRKSEENSKSGASAEMREPPYWAHYSTPRLLIHTVINSKYFDLAIAAVIGLNVITMAMEYYMMPEELEFALKIFNFFFTSVFILEAAMKIVALGFYRYIKDRWNQLDMIIVILSIVGIILEEMRTNVIPINPTIIRVMRVLRIARVLKLLKMAKGIRALLDTVIQALPQVGNLGLLFFLLFFIFAALGVELFGRLDCSLDNPCEGLSVHAHFKHFGLAFLTLFRVATGDNWNGIMKDTLRDNCDKSDNCVTNCCVSPIIAPVYFVVFVLMAQFVLVNVVVAVLMKHLEETYKYKELDDELEEELQAEMCALALAGKTTPGAGIEIKESHKLMEDEAILLDEEVAEESAMNADAECKDSGSGGDKSGGPQMSTLPSFSFSVRPPSEEQTRSEDTDAMSPINPTLTIDCMASSWSSMDSNRLGVSPGSMTATSGSSPASERSVRISSPPIRRAPSPYLLSLQSGGGGGGGSHHYFRHQPHHHHCYHPGPGAAPQPKMASLGYSLGQQRRPLVKQYSMDVGSDPSLNNLNSSLPDVSGGGGGSSAGGGSGGGGSHPGSSSSRPRTGLPLYFPNCQHHIQQHQQQLQQMFRNKTSQSKTAIYRSQPSLKDMKAQSGDMRPASGSLDSSQAPSKAGDLCAGANAERSVPTRDKIKHKLLRSRSSGAKYSRFRDKYKQSNMNKSQHLNNSDTSLAKEKNYGAKRGSGAGSGSGRTGSNDTGSDVEESLFSDWGSEEAACDLEVKMITGGTEDEEDDIRPTLSPYASLDAGGGPTDAMIVGNTIPSAADSYASSSGSTPRGVTETTPRLQKQMTHPKCKSPMPPSMLGTASHGGNNPGIDNTSFELDEECAGLSPPSQHGHAPYFAPCKSPRPYHVRRSNSFSPSKLTPKAFSPPMLTATRSDRSSHSPYQSISPLALPPSPLALEDSAFKLRTPETAGAGGLAPVGHSPIPIGHSHTSSNTLMVPTHHSLYPHLRSPSPTPPSKQVHLSLPPTELGASYPPPIRRQPSPALRRQQTLSRSFAVDESGPASPPSPSSSSNAAPNTSLRRRIPHTLSVDSAFLAPPSVGPPSYVLNDPYLEVHAGCRVPSPLPSPRNSQQTLPGMFTRSTSPAVPLQSQQRSPSFSSPPPSQQSSQQQQAQKSSADVSSTTARQSETLLGHETNDCTLTHFPEQEKHQQQQQKQEKQPKEEQGASNANPSQDGQSLSSSITVSNIHSTDNAPTSDQSQSISLAKHTATTGVKGAQLEPESFVEAKTSNTANESKS